MVEENKSVGYSKNIGTVWFYKLTSEDSKHYVLANLMCWSWIPLDIESGLVRHTVLASQWILTQLCGI